MNQSNIYVRLVPKSKHKFLVIVIWWENPLFRYFILLSDLPPFDVGKICAVSKCCNSSCKFPYYHWHLSSCVWLGFNYDRDPFTFSLYSRIPGPDWLWMFLELLLFFSLRYVWPSSISLWLYWELRPRKAHEAVKEGPCWRKWEPNINGGILYGKHEAKHFIHIISFNLIGILRCW